MLWGLLGVIAIAAQISAGASWSIILLITITCNSLLIAFLALWGYGYKKYTLLDWTCLALAILAITLWQITSQPVIAIAFSTLGDFFAALPTIVKSYKDPGSELALGWCLVMTASLLSILSTRIWNAANLISPVYTFLETALVTCLVFFGQRSLRNHAMK